MRGLVKNEKEITLICTIISCITGLVTALTVLFDKENKLGISRVLLITIFTISTILCILCFYLYIKLKKQDIHLKKATHVIEGRLLTSFNEASLLRTITKDYKVNEHTFIATISGNDLEFEFEDKGVRVSSESSEEGYLFSIGSDKFIPYRDLICYSYDLLNDPLRKNQIRPLLKSPDGTAKQVLAPFLNSIKVFNPFHVYLYAKFPDCMNFGLDYVGSTLSFTNTNKIEKNVSILNFKKHFPKWVNVYEVVNDKKELVRTLSVDHQTDDTVTYRDEMLNCNGQKVLLYHFERNFA